MRHTVATVLFVLSASSVGCAAARESWTDAPGGRVWVMVTNESDQPVEVSAAASGADQRLGRVEPGRAGLFLLNPTLAGAGQVEVFAQPRGGEKVGTGPVTPIPGQVLDVEVTPRPAGAVATRRTLRT